MNNPSQTKDMEDIREYVILETKRNSIRKARAKKLITFAEIKKKRKAWLKGTL